MPKSISIQRGQFDVLKVCFCTYQEDNMTPVNDPNTAGTTTLKILFSKLPSLSATEEVNVVLRCSKLHFNGNDAQGESASPRIYPIVLLLNLHGLYGWAGVSVNDCTNTTAIRENTTSAKVNNLVNGCMPLIGYPNPLPCSKIVNSSASFRYAKAPSQVTS